MSETTIGEEHIRIMERYIDHLEEKTPRKNLFLHRPAITISMEEHFEETDNDLHVHFEHLPSLMSILEFIVHCPLDEQCAMMCNILTVSGYTHTEIAEAMGFDVKSFRRKLARARKHLVR